MSENNIKALVVIAFVLLALSFLTVGWRMGFHMMGARMGWGGGWWMGVGMVVFWILIGVGAYMLITGLTAPRESEYDRALAMAKERYARGEITLEEFEEIKKNLS